MLTDALIRTTRDAVKELRRVTLVRPPFPIKLGIRYFRRWMFELEITMTVLDTNSGAHRNQRLLFECALPVSRQKFVRFVEVAVREAVLHEIYESLHIDGKRVCDPHEGCVAGHAYALFNDMRCFTRTRSRAARPES